MKTIHEPARETPIVADCDLCVVGGSCTGLFAAVRAARMGLSVTLIEQNIVLGGMAVAAQVNEWHSLHDMSGDRQIIGGLTVEVLDRLKKRNAVRELKRKFRGLYYSFNSAELALELDALAAENRIRLFLKSSCVAVVRDSDQVTAVIIEDKSGRRAIRAKIFIDASGDGDLLRQAGFSAWKNEILQPISYQMLVAGLQRMVETTGRGIWEQVRHRAAEFSFPLENATPWINSYPAPADLHNVYGARLNGVDASDADQMTSAILESRRRHRALLDMVRAQIGPDVSAVALAHALGVRETWHARCLHKLNAGELMSGTAFPDAIAFGTYPVDIHSAEGTILRYLDGTEEIVARDGSVKMSHWREGSGTSPDFYQIPYRSLVPENAKNLLVAGRLLDADREAFGGVRVMVNMNQTGEAAGVAAALALKGDLGVSEVPAGELRQSLVAGGSLLS